PRRVSRWAEAENKRPPAERSSEDAPSRWALLGRRAMICSDLKRIRPVFDSLRFKSRPRPEKGAHRRSSAHRERSTQASLGTATLRKAPATRKSDGVAGVGGGYRQDQGGACFDEAGARRGSGAGGDGALGASVAAGGAHGGRRRDSPKGGPPARRDRGVRR